MTMTPRPRYPPTSTAPMTDQGEYVADADALRYILEANGFKVVKGDFTRRDGVRTRLAVIPMDPRPMLRAAIEALARWEGDDEEDEVLPCETSGCLNKGVTWRGSYFLCDDHIDGRDDA